MSSKLFLDKLSQIGYPGAKNLDVRSIDFLFCNKKLAPFFDWFCQNVHSENIVRPDEIRRYEAIEASGAEVLDVKELKEIDALSEQDDEKALEMLQGEVRKLEWKLENYDKQIRVLRIQKQELRSNYDSLLGCINELELDMRRAKRRLELSKTSFLNDNIAMNGVMDAIDKKLRKIFECLEMVADSKKGWMSVADLNSFRHCSENSIEDAVALLKERFAEKKPEIVDRYERNKQEYQLICQGLSNNKMRFFKAEVCREGSESALTTARSIFHSMDLSTFRSTHEVLSAKLSDANNAIEKLNIDYRSLMSSVSNSVIKEANMSSMLILSTEYNSKLKRLQSSIATLDEVLFNVGGHLSRAKFISIAIESEKQYFKYVADSIDDFVKLIQEENRSFNERKKFVSDSKSASVVRRQLSNGSREATCDSIAILGINNETLLSGDQDEILQQELVKLKEKYIILSDTLHQNFNSEKTLLRKMDRSLCLLQASIWSECATRNEVPTITPRAIIDSLNKAETNFNIIQNNLFEAMENYQTKEKVLRSDVCLRHKRAVYVYFYINPDSLRQTINIIRTKENKQTSI